MSDTKTNPHSEEVSTFVCRDHIDNKVYIIHLFVYPDSDSNIFKSLIDGNGYFYIPYVKLDEPLKNQRFWSQGRLLAIFDGKVEEAEVKIKLESTGFISDDDEFVLVGCDRNGLEFSAECSG